MSGAKECADVRDTEAYAQLVKMTKHQYYAMVKYRKLKQDFEFERWLKGYLERKADIVLTFHEPRACYELPGDRVM